METPRILLTDPAVRAERREALASKMEALAEADAAIEEFAKKLPKKKSKKKTVPKPPPAKNPVAKIIKTASKEFDEHKHPRDESGKFAKSSHGDLPTNDQKNTWLAADDLETVQGHFDIVGDQGFNDILAGLAFGAIDEVMTFPKNMPKAIMEQGYLWGARGIYDSESNNIGVDTNVDEGKERAISTIHEIGHFLDYKMIPGRHLTDDPQLMAAFNNSNTIKTIQGIASNPDIDKKTKSSVAYLLTPTEIFARAFAQYIATKSSNSTLKRENADRQAREGTLWEPDDFEPIRKQFDRVFKSQLRTPKNPAKSYTPRKTPVKKVVKPRNYREVR